MVRTDPVPSFPRVLSASDSFVSSGRVDVTASPEITHGVCQMLEPGLVEVQRAPAP